MDSTPKHPLKKTRIQAADPIAEMPLPVLVSKVLLAFAIEFERESEVSLAICANVLRLMGEEGTRVRDLPRLAGVSREAIGTSANFLVKRHYALLKPESSGSRAKMLTLTTEGRRSGNHRLLETIEDRWLERFGKEALRKLREPLAPIIGDGNPNSPLFVGLQPTPENWRNSVPKPETLPHYPMVLHRGRISGR